MSREARDRCDDVVMMTAEQHRAIHSMQFDSGPAIAAEVQHRLDLRWESIMQSLRALRDARGGWPSHEEIMKWLGEWRRA